VAIDIDGTLGDYHLHFIRFLEGYYGRPFPYGWEGNGDWEAFLGLSRQEYRDAKLAYRQGGGKRTMPAHRGAKALADACRQAGAEIWITTTRPWMRLDNIDPDTREWLSRNQIPYDHILYDEGKYPQLAMLVDPGRVVFVLDDLTAQYQAASFVFGEANTFLRVARHNAYWRRILDYNNLLDLTVATKVATGRVKDWYHQQEDRSEQGKHQSGLHTELASGDEGIHPR
jgi:hypothetical protein